MNYNELKQLTLELIDKLNSSSIESINIEFEQSKISISKSSGIVSSQPVSSPNSCKTEPVSTQPSANEKTVLSPMVGTFYTSPTPDSKPFINVGDKICIGDTICIIEAMKLMNEIVSDQSGIVKEILVQNGEVVEFNQPIIIVEQ